MAAFGGLTKLEISKNGKVRATRLCLPRELLETLEHNILLFYTGAVRNSATILEQQNDAVEKRGDGVLANLSQIKDIGIEICDAIVSGNLHRFGQLMDVHWQVKKRLSSGVSTPQIDAWYQLARRNGAIGGKISGAGGGGFLILYCEQNKARLREAMRRAGLRELNFRFEFEGSKVVFDMVSRDARLAYIQRQEAGDARAPIAWPVTRPVDTFGTKSSKEENGRATRSLS